MPSRRESERARARARLQAETPAPVDDGSLLSVQEEAEAIIHEAKGRSPSTAKELAASAINDVSRSYYQYLMERRCRHSKPPKFGP